MGLFSVGHVAIVKKSKMQRILVKIAERIFNLVIDSMKFVMVYAISKPPAKAIASLLQTYGVDSLDLYDVQYFL